jgi:hypothetical protein
MKKYETLAREFPDFDQSTLPLIPETWADTSWRNDACPSFTSTRFGKTAVVYIDFADPALREFEEGKRFTVVEDAEDGATVSVLETDDFHEVRDYCNGIPRFDGTRVCKTQTTGLIDIQYLATVAKARGFVLGGYAHTGVNGFGTSGPEVGYVQICAEGKSIYANPDYVINDETGCTWDQRVSPHPGEARVDSYGVSRLLAHPRMEDIAERYAA